MKCMNCGEELPIGAKFCPNCGSQVIWPAAAPTMNVAPNNGSYSSAVPPTGLSAAPSTGSPAATEEAREAMRKAEQAEAARRALAAEKERLSGTLPNIPVQPAVQTGTTKTGKKAQANKQAKTGKKVQTGSQPPKRSHKLIILLAVLGVLVVGVAAYFLLAPKTIRLSDYFTIQVNGADGYGSAQLVWDEEKLTELNQAMSKRNPDAFEAAGGSMDRIVSPSIRSDRPDGQLRNGDIVNIRYPDLTAYEKALRIRFKYYGAATVEGLKPVSRIDLLDHVVFDYKGYNGWGIGEARLDSEGLTVGDLTVTLTQDAEGGRLRFNLVNRTTGEAASALYGTDIKADRLSNGSTMTYRLLSVAGDEKWLGTNGVELVAEEHDYEVEGLAALTVIDFFTPIQVKYSGFNTRGRMELTLSEDSITAGDVTFRLSLQTADDADNLLPVYQLETDLEDGRRIRLIPDSTIQGKIKNGTEITYTVPNPDKEDVTAFLARYGLEAAMEKNYYAEGLQELQNVNVLDALDVKISGYNGYGILQTALKEESAEAGEYTLQYALPKNVFGMDVTVVTKSGEKLYTVSYRTDAGLLKNGDLVTLKADAETLRKIDEEYGIVLPESRNYQISGLKDTTAIEPRDYIKPVFTKKGDKITGTLTLTQDSFKAGDYTIRLSIEDESKGDKRKAVFAIVDAAGKELAKGSYTLNNIGKAGTNATIDYNGELDLKTAAATYGLLLKADPVEVKIAVS
ncbi:MAG: zinc ribbon domain-containing protein [Firmicutes bacterium]|nr:zinc ribbon domain-containing protein [Bacillota bacterium]